MDDTLTNFLRGSIPWLALFVVPLIGWLIWRVYQETLSFLWTDLCYRFPLIGKIDQLAQSPTPAAEEGWLTGERRLCADYYKHVQAVDRWTFENYLLYLKKALDTGRHPMSIGMWIFLAVMTVAEGFGFAYLLGAQVAADGSQNIRVLLMVAVVVLISGIFMGLTHFAGHQLYRTRLMRNCFKRFRARGIAGYLSTDTVSLRDDQRIDDDKLAESQCMARIAGPLGDRGSYKLVIFTVLLIAAVTVGSTVMRLRHFEYLRGQSTADAAADLFGSANTKSSLPDAVAAPQAAADEKAKSEIDSAEEGEAVTAFILLGLMFAATQLMGIAASFKWCFGGLESPAAFGATHGHPTYASYFAPFQRRVDIAQARLQELQQKFDASGDHNNRRTKKFLEYMREVAASNVPDILAGHPGSSAVSGGIEVVERAMQRLRNTRNAKEKVAILSELTDVDRAMVQDRLRRQQGGGASRIEEEFRGLI